VRGGGGFFDINTKDVYCKEAGCDKPNKYHRTAMKGLHRLVGSRPRRWSLMFVRASILDRVGRN
jgi:hypothetical protein